MRDKYKIGEVVWRDLTVKNANEVSEFYTRVIGLKKEAVSMGQYDDFNLCCPNSGEPVAGVCHAEGDNADMPSQWMMYVCVENVEQSVQTVEQLGGKVLKGPTQFSGDTYYLIEDPAGAVMTLFSSQ